MKDENIVGIISLDEYRELRFVISSFREKQLAHIREFVKTPRYSGYTKRGIAFNITLLEQVINILNDLVTAQNINQEQEIGKIPKNNFVDIVLRFVKAQEGNYALDIREYLKSNRYEGWTKKGVRVPVESLDEAKIFLLSCRDALVEELHEKETAYILELQSNKTKPNEIAEESNLSLFEEILGDKILNFPKDFMESSTSRQFKEISLPKEPLRIGVFRDGVQYVTTNADFMLELRNEIEAKYLIYAQLRGATSVKVPKDMFAIFKAVKKYEKYAREVKNKLIEFHKKENSNYLVAKNKARFDLQKIGIPWIE